MVSRVAGVWFPTWSHLRSGGVFFRALQIFLLLKYIVFDLDIVFDGRGDDLKLQSHMAEKTTVKIMDLDIRVENAVFAINQIII